MPQRRPLRGLADGGDGRPIDGAGAAQAGRVLGRFAGAGPIKSPVPHRPRNPGETDLGGSLGKWGSGGLGV